MIGVRRPVISTYIKIANEEGPLSTEHFRSGNAAQNFSPDALSSPSECDDTEQ
jgi:hypothetical protein